MKIKGITLLSVEEYRKYKENITPIDNLWWLRSPGYFSFLAACVHPNGDVNEDGARVDYSNAVRPALIAEDAPSVGSCFNFEGVSWTMISANYALADEALCEMAFRENWKRGDDNRYEASDIKAYLDSCMSKMRESELVIEPSIIRHRISIREAIDQLERLQNPEVYEPAITDTAYKALAIAIEALYKQLAEEGKQ